MTRCKGPPAHEKDMVSRSSAGRLQLPPVEVESLLSTVAIAKFWWVAGNTRRTARVDAVTHRHACHMSMHIDELDAGDFTVSLYRCATERSWQHMHSYAYVAAFDRPNGKENRSVQAAHRRSYTCHGYEVLQRMHALQRCGRHTRERRKRVKARQGQPQHCIADVQRAGVLLWASWHTSHITPHAWAVARQASQHVLQCKFP